MTNRKWIDGLSNEQLVKLFRTFKEDPCTMCAYYHGPENEECGFCYDGQVAWLDQEHDSDSFEERHFNYCV